MFYPDDNYIEKIVKMEVELKLGKIYRERKSTKPSTDIKFIGYFKNPESFAKYCWENELERNMSDSDYIDWRAVYADLEKFGFVGHEIMFLSSESANDYGKPRWSVTLGFSIEEDNE